MHLYSQLSLRESHEGSDPVLRIQPRVYKPQARADALSGLTPDSVAVSEPRLLESAEKEWFSAKLGDAFRVITVEGAEDPAAEEYEIDLYSLDMAPVLKDIPLYSSFDLWHAEQTENLRISRAAIELSAYLTTLDGEGGYSALDLFAPEGGTLLFLLHHEVFRCASAEEDSLMS